MKNRPSNQVKEVQNQPVQQEFFPNREALNFILTVQNNCNFVTGISKMVFEKNDLSKLDELKKAADQLIFETKRILDLLPK